MRNALLIFAREVRDQLRDRRTLFMIAVLPLLLYPALGIGMFQGQLLFNQKPRQVVILGAEDLPTPSPLVSVETDTGPRTQFDPVYLGSEAEARRLRVTTDRAADAGPIAELKLTAARLVEKDLLERDRLQEQIESLTEGDADIPGLAVAVEVLTQRISQTLADADIQVLILVPEGLDEALAEYDAELIERSAAKTDETDPGAANGDATNQNAADQDAVEQEVDEESRSSEPSETATEAEAAEDAGQDEVAERPRPRIVQNSADEKSLAAAGRVQDVIANWERRLLAERLANADLPSDLVDPIDAEKTDLAGQESLSANIWGRLFPFILVMMSVTGAFYPAIDLGAGEKERGTMETLLICAATRGEIVAGKFLTVLLFSLATTLLNIISMGVTANYVLSVAAGEAEGSAQLSGLSLPPVTSLGWIAVLAIPLAAMFSALSLALAMFAKSSKEGQYYLTPLLVLSISMAVFCIWPGNEITAFYSLLPVIGPALLLRGLLAAGGASAGLYWYVIPVVVTSVGYSVLALWWARDQFRREDILFREADKFDLGAWVRRVVTDKGLTPSPVEATTLLVVIMLVTFFGMTSLRSMLEAGGGGSAGLIAALITQQVAVYLIPSVALGLLLTSSMRHTFRLRFASVPMFCIAAVLPFALHPLAVELLGFLQEREFFPALSEETLRMFASMGDADLPWWVVFLAFAVAPAICEEVAFRGFLLSGFSSGRRYGLGIMISSVAFGVVHMIPQQVFNAALLGMVVGLLAVRSGSLLPGILFHLIFNSLQVGRSRLEAGMLDSVSFNGWVFKAGDGGELRYGPGLLLVCGVGAIMGVVWLLRHRTFEEEVNRPDSLGAENGASGMRVRDEADTIPA